MKHNPKLKQVLDFVIWYWKTHKMSPTVREISRHMNNISTSVVKYYLDQLQDTGFIDVHTATARGIVPRGMNITFEEEVNYE